MQAQRQIKQIVGENIRALRAEKRLTRRAFGDVAGIDAMSIYKWERGLHRPSDKSLAVLAASFDREMAWFYTDHDSEAAA